MSQSFFSENPDKAWVEKFFLIYTPVWMLLMGLSVALNKYNLGDTEKLIHSLVVFLPIVLIPMFLAKKYTDKVWYESYWFKVNLYLFIFSFFGNYFGTEYFFDVLGMVYNYPNVTTNLDSAIVGSGEQKVPLIMYFYTHAYFMTYHVTANIVLRKLRGLRLPAMWAIFPIFVFVIGYFWAWMETKMMANPALADTFYYQKLDVMLAYGSAIYAIYFIASFPIYYFLDEYKNTSWSWLITASAALSASMLTFFMLDFATHFIGTI